MEGPRLLESFTLPRGIVKASDIDDILVALAQVANDEIAVVSIYVWKDGDPDAPIPEEM